MAEHDDAGVDAEAELVSAARDDPAAFERLHELYAARVYRYLRLRTNSPEDAADLTQSVFLKAWHALPGYRAGKAPFAAFLFTIARNAAADAHRRTGSGTTVPWDGVPDPVDHAAIDPEFAALRAERLQMLHAVIATLDPQKRELLALRFAGGLSSREIAAVTGRSEAAVKKHLTRIIDALKEHYRDELT